MEQKEIETIVTKVVRQYSQALEDKSFPVEASARHVHLTREAVKVLFGPEAVLECERELSLPGFLAKQRVSIITSEGIFRNVAVLGPERSAVQVELSATDARTLGIDPPVNSSGDFTGAADVYLLGEAGMLAAPSSAIIARAHLHLNEQEAQDMRLKDGQTVSVSVSGERPTTLQHVLVRVAAGMKATLHIDLDEANACGYRPGVRGALDAHREK